MSSKHDSDRNQRPTVGYFALIFSVAIAILVGVWIYYLLGDMAVDRFYKIAIAIAIVVFMIFAWRLHRWRQHKALELLQRWAERDNVPPTRPRRD